MKIGDLVKWTVPEQLTATEYWAGHEWKVRYWNSQKQPGWTRPRYGIIIKFWGSCGDDPIISWFNGETYGIYRGDVEVISGEEQKRKQEPEDAEKEDRRRELEDAQNLEVWMTEALVKQRELVKELKHLNGVVDEETEVIK